MSVRPPGSETALRTVAVVRNVCERQREEVLVRAREFTNESKVYDCVSHEHCVWAAVVRYVLHVADL